MISQVLARQNIPSLLPRAQMLDILQRREYGYLPQKPEKLTFEVAENTIRRFCAGKAYLHKVTANCAINGRDFSFPFYFIMPRDGERHPFFVHINFRDCVPDLYQPTEELVDNGFVVFSFDFNDVTADNGDFTDGLAGILYENGVRGPADASKIAMWAWAAQRVLDYAETRTDVLDLSRAIVCGHSRLGKTALLAAATDERFAFAYSNDSGCSGAALSRVRGEGAETIRDICKNFPYWFCENYKDCIGNEDMMPFDQHYLLASIAPAMFWLAAPRRTAGQIPPQRCSAA